MTPFHPLNSNIGPIGRGIVKTVAKTQQTVANVQRKSAKSQRIDSQSIKTQKSKMLQAKTKDGKPLFTEKEIDDMISASNTSARKQELKALGHEQFAKQLLNELDQLNKRKNKN
jgi:cytochrome oxidase assembly protein ShyY1